jgi:hypothetical protein
MTAAKQPRGNAGKGRKKGVPNKVTGDVKAMVRPPLNALVEPNTLKSKLTRTRSLL